MASSSSAETMIVLLCALQLLVAIAARASLGTWLSPGAFFSAFWVIAGSGAALVASFAFGTKIDPRALAVIASFSAAVWLGDELSLRLGKTGTPAGANWEPLALHQKNLRRWIVILCIAALAVPLRIMQDHGKSILELSSIVEWMEFAARLAYARYHYNYTEPLDVRVLIAGLYLAALLGGLNVARATRTADRFLAGFPTVVGVVIATITTSKAVFLVSAIMTVSAYLAFPGRSADMNHRANFLRAGLKVVMAAALVAFFFIGLLMVRYRLTDLQQWALIADRLAGYLVGHMTAFSAWIELEGALANRDLTWGAYTFTGPYSAIAGYERTPGVYEVLAFNDYSGESNVFTAFRGLIMDFSFPAALLVVMVLSISAGWHFRRLLRSAWSSVGYVIVTSFYLFTLWSHVINIFSYNSVLAATAAFIVIVIWSTRNQPALPQSSW